MYKNATFYEKHVDQNYFYNLILTPTYNLVFCLIRMSCRKEIEIMCYYM